jgi:hypothetical protein
MPDRQRFPEAISAELDNLTKWAYQIANGMEHIASRNVSDTSIIETKRVQISVHK